MKLLQEIMLASRGAMLVDVLLDHSLPQNEGVFIADGILTLGDFKFNAAIHENPDKIKNKIHLILPTIL